MNVNEQIAKTKEWLQFFEGISCFYKAGLLHSWEKYPRYETDIWDSLFIFLGGYAFERKGRNPSYSHAAVDALFDCKKGNNGNFNQEIIGGIWQQFGELLEGQKLNEERNPLYPSKSTPAKKSSVIQVVLNNNMTQKNLTFATYLENLIKNNNINSAFDLLTSIRGIGKKIASLYLRDLVDVMNITLDNNTRYLLQPIDIWVERVVIGLAKDEFSKFEEKIKNKKKLNDKEKEKLAQWIVQTSKQDINPERVNMGIWYFCSQIAGSEYRLKKVLEDFGAAKELLDDYKIRIQKVCKNC